MQLNTGVHTFQSEVHYDTWLLLHCLVSVCSEIQINEKEYFFCWVSSSKLDKLSGVPQKEVSSCGKLADSKCDHPNSYLIFSNSKVNLFDSKLDCFNSKLGFFNTKLDFLNSKLDFPFRNSTFSTQKSTFSIKKSTFSSSPLAFPRLKLATFVIVTLQINMYEVPLKRGNGCSIECNVHLGHLQDLFNVL